MEADKYSQIGAALPGQQAQLSAGQTFGKNMSARPSREQRIVNQLNADRDINTTHDFDYWIFRDEEILDTQAFTGMVQKNSEFFQFVGNQGWDPNTIDISDVTEYYEDFLGINFKKIGKAIGGAATDVAHGVRSVAVGAAHDARDLADNTADVTRDAAVDVAHAGRTAGLAAAHTERNFAVDVAHLQRAEFEAVKPYWKPILGVAAMAVLIASGVGIPAALAIGGALLTGLNQIGKTQQQPYIPADGDGGGMPDDGSDGMPDGADLDDPGDTGEGLTPQEQQAAVAQHNADLQAEAEAVARKKKILIYSAAIMAVVVIYWFFIRKK
jgi:hypothetical protein